jgi:Ca2+-binding EF-hand superfamily protein
MSAIQSLAVPAGTETRAVRAEQRAAMRERLFQRLDRDGSGGISRQEFSRALQNLPGGGSSAGAATGAQDRTAAIMTRLDTDGDGQVSAGELDAALNRRDAPGAARGGGAAAPDTLGDLLAQQTGLARRHHGHGVDAAAHYARAATRSG